MFQFLDRRRSSLGNDSVFVLSLLCPLRPFVPLRLLCRLQQCVVREYQVLQHYLLPSLVEGQVGGSATAKILHPKGGLQLSVPLNLKLTFRER